ncbi:ferredoxin [Rugosimonospora acidiphila]|uniref:Ferredoxin n=1 Tax=Rugosimonospora acidiphila TaxID=556531 RepID=A0ABP9RSX9_9ACTN
MRIDVHTERCIGSGVCALVAPELFDQREDDGVVVLLDPDPAPDQHENAHEAATRCPASVIEIREAG